MKLNLDKLGQKLHGKIDGSIDQLKEAQAHLNNLEKETEDTLKNKMNKAKETLDAKKQGAVAAKERLETLVNNKIEASSTMVAEWKENRDRKKLEKRADHAEKNADDSIELALFYIAEAQVAILEAVTARKDADDAV